MNVADQPAAVRWDTLRGWLLLIIVGGVGFLLLTITVETTGGVDRFDLTVMDAINALRTPFGVRVGNIVTWFGSYRAVVLLALGMAAFIAVRSRRLLEPVVMAVTVALVSSLVYLVKIAVGRPRPPSARGLGEAITDYSFPSGHTTSGSVLFVLAAVLLSGTIRSRGTRRVLVSIGFMAAAAIGGSRVYLGYHWATDVLGGWCLTVVLVGLAMLPVVSLGSARPAEPVLDGAVVDSWITAPLLGFPAVAAGSQDPVGPAAPSPDRRAKG